MATDDEFRAAGGAAALANPAGARAGLVGGADLDRRVTACLAAAAAAELERLPTTLAEDAALLKALNAKALNAQAGGGPQGAGKGAGFVGPSDPDLARVAKPSRQRLALEFRIGKKLVLQRCAAALRAQV